MEPTFNNAQTPLLQEDRNSENGTFRPYLSPDFINNGASDPYVTAMANSVQPLTTQQGGAEPSMVEHLEKMQSDIRLSFLTQCRIGGGFLSLLLFVCVCLAFLRPLCADDIQLSAAVVLPTTTDVTTRVVPTMGVPSPVVGSGGHVNDVTLHSHLGVSSDKSSSRCMSLTTFVVYCCVCGLLGMTAVAMVARAACIMRRRYHQVSVVVTLLHAARAAPRLQMSIEDVQRLVSDGDLRIAQQLIQNLRSAARSYGSVL